VAASQGDLLQLVDNQTYLGQQILNVYYYRVTPALGITGNYLELLNDYWEDNVLPPICAIQNDGLSHVSREWRNLSNNVDLFTASNVIPGTNAEPGTAQEPSFVSAGFILRRESLVTRNGYKRFAGLSENLISGNTWVGGATLLNNIATALAGDLNIGIISSAEPVIVKRPIDPPVGVYQYSSIGSAAFRSIGTQNTRKAGRGI
jgi:hypothetical protein